MQNQTLKHGKRADILENEHMKECFITNEASIDLCTAVAIQIQYLAVITLFVQMSLILFLSAKWHSCLRDYKVFTSGKQQL